MKKLILMFAFSFKFLFAMDASDEATGYWISQKIGNDLLKQALTAAKTGSLEDFESNFKNKISEIPENTKNGEISIGEALSQIAKSGGAYRDVLLPHNLVSMINKAKTNLSKCFNIRSTQISGLMLMTIYIPLILLISKITLTKPNLIDALAFIFYFNVLFNNLNTLASNPFTVGFSNGTVDPNWVSKIQNIFEEAKINFVRSAESLHDFLTDLQLDKGFNLKLFSEFEPKAVVLAS